MPSLSPVLIAVDDSESSRRTVAYVGKVAAGLPSLEIRLVHVEAPSEEPPEHTRAVLDAATAQLRALGIDPARIHESARLRPAAGSIAGECVGVAQEHGCPTIAIGRNGFAWLADGFHPHPADELVRRAEGHTVWVVE